MSSDRERQWQELRLPQWVPGGGRRRYAAAMWLHRAGEMSDDILELYRTLALDDRAEPVIELRRAGLPLPAHLGTIG